MTWREKPTNRGRLVTFYVHVPSQSGRFEETEFKRLAAERGAKVFERWIKVDNLEVQTQVVVIRKKEKES